METDTTDGLVAVFSLAGLQRCGDASIETGFTPDGILLIREQCEIY